MNIFFLVFSALLAAIMLSIFLAYVAIPAIIVGSIYVMYKDLKKRFFPYGLRDALMPHKGVQPHSEKIIDVDFHEIK